MKTRVLAPVIASLLLWSCGSSSQAPSSAPPPEKAMMAKESAGSFYAEGPHKGRLYVFGTEKAHKAFEESQQVPNITKMYIGAGPEGQTVVLEADSKSAELQDRLKRQYEAKHGAALH